MSFFTAPLLLSVFFYQRLSWLHYYYCCLSCRMEGLLLNVLFGELRRGVSLYTCVYSVMIARVARYVSRCDVFLSGGHAGVAFLDIRCNWFYVSPLQQTVVVLIVDLYDRALEPIRESKYHRHFMFMSLWA